MFGGTESRRFCAVEQKVSAHKWTDEGLVPRSRGSHDCIKSKVYSSEGRPFSSGSLFTIITSPVLYLYSLQRYVFDQIAAGYRGSNMWLWIGVLALRALRRADAGAGAGSRSAFWFRRRCCRADAGAGAGRRWLWIGVLVLQALLPR